MNLSNFSLSPTGPNLTSGVTVDYSQVVRELAQSIDQSIVNAIFLIFISWCLSYFLIDWVLHAFNYPKKGLLRLIPGVFDEVAGLCVLYIGVTALIQGVFSPVQEFILIFLLSLACLNFLFSLLGWVRNKEYLKVMNKMSGIGD